MNALNNVDKTDRGYSPAPTDDPIRFRGSEVKVTAGFRSGEGEGVHNNAGVLKSIYYYLLFSILSEGVECRLDL